jgi:hypothetical protein
MSDANSEVVFIEPQEREIDSEEGFGGQDREFVATEQRVIEPEISPVDAEIKAVNPERRVFGSDQPFGGTGIRYFESEQG